MKVSPTPTHPRASRCAYVPGPATPLSAPRSALLRTVLCCRIVDILPRDTAMARPSTIPT